MSGYAGWLHKEEHRELRQVERELYPSVREMERERNRTSLKPTISRADRTSPQDCAIGSDEKEGTA